MMMRRNTHIALRNPAPVYFGKIASRGDFVRSASGARLIGLVDNWLAQGMDLLIAAPDWKHRYDEHGPIDILFLGTRKEHVVCGAIVPSKDVSGRRFPFLGATLFEVDDAMRFLPLSMLGMERHINHQRSLIQLAASSHDAGDTLSRLEDASRELRWDNAKSRESYVQFLSATTLDHLSHDLRIGMGQSTIRQMILALGYLLRPIRDNRSFPPRKGIVLPLPHDPARSALVKCFWLNLMSPFLSGTDFEISIFTYQRQAMSKLLVTFNGATPAAFCALFSGEENESAHAVDLSCSFWVEECVRQDAGILQLASYLEHGGLTLQQIADTFLRDFIG